jgi:CHRD domain
VIHRLLIIVAGVLVVAAVGAAQPAAAHHKALAASAFMTGDAVVDEDGVGDADGFGSATFLQTDRRTVCYGFTVSGADTPTAIAIYKGAAGETGRTVLPFANVPKGEDGQPAGDPGWSSGCREAENAAEVATIRRIRKNPQNYYLLMKTEEFPGGAIRGQLDRLQY